MRLSGSIMALLGFLERVYKDIEFSTENGLSIEIKKHREMDYLLISANLPLQREIAPLDLLPDVKEWACANKTISDFTKFYSTRLIIEISFLSGESQKFVERYPCSVYSDLSSKERHQAIERAKDMISKTSIWDSYFNVIDIEKNGEVLVLKVLTTSKNVDPQRPSEAHLKHALCNESVIKDYLIKDGVVLIEKDGVKLSYLLKYHCPLSRK